MEISRRALQVSAVFQSDSGVVFPRAYDAQGNLKPNKEPHNLIVGADCLLGLYGKIMSPSYPVLCGGPPPYGG